MGTTIQFKYTISRHIYQGLLRIYEDNKRKSNNFTQKIPAVELPTTGVQQVCHQAAIHLLRMTTSSELDKRKNLKKQQEDSKKISKKKVI